MRYGAAVLLLGLLAGCAARQQAPGTISVNWSAVQGLAPGTELAIYVGERDARHGALEVVASESLVVRGRRGLEVLSRAKIERIAVRTATGASRKGPIVQTALIGGAIAAALALFAKMLEENPRPDGQKWTLFIVGTTAAAGIGAMRAPRETFSERLVYIRP